MGASLSTSDIKCVTAAFSRAVCACMLTAGPTVSADLHLVQDRHAEVCSPCMPVGTRRTRQLGVSEESGRIFDVLSDVVLDVVCGFKVDDPE